MRLKELQKHLQKKGIGAALFYNTDGIAHDSNLFYLTGYKGVGLLLVPAREKPFLIVPAMEYERASGSINAYLLYKKKFFETAKLRLKGLRLKKIGIDKKAFTLSTFSRFRKVFKQRTADVSDICYGLRKTKTAKEISVIKKACAISDMVLGKCFAGFSKFKSESDVKTFLHCETIKAGCELAFPPIVASGRNSSQPHYDGNGKLQKGFCVIDFGVRYKGYCSDTTRTVCIGKPSKKQKDAYNKLLEVQCSLIEKANVGAKCSDLYDYALKSIGKSFTHGLGHGIGVDVHEFPGLVTGSEDVVEKDMIFTVEPGSYFPGKFGIRIEDDVLATGKGAVVLTKIKKGLTVV